jgi:hypothetical protein
VQGTAAFAVGEPAQARAALALVHFPPPAILFAGLWFVVKTAVLSALRRHQRDLDERPAPVITKK